MITRTLLTKQKKCYQIRSPHLIDEVRKEFYSLSYTFVSWKDVETEEQVQKDFQNAMELYKELKSTNDYRYLPKPKINYSWETIEEREVTKDGL